MNIQYFGLTGSMGSGKGEIAKLLQDRGYAFISLSDIVRAEAAARGLPETREHLQNVGNELRSKDGAGALGTRVREAVLREPEKNWVIDGIRNPGEIAALRLLPSFRLIGVSADREILLERIAERQREGSALSREEIAAKLDREWGKNEPPDGQQVGKCLEDCDYFILNEGTLEELKAKLDHYLKLLSG